MKSRICICCGLAIAEGAQISVGNPNLCASCLNTAAGLPEWTNASGATDFPSRQLVPDSSQIKATSLRIGHILVVDDQVFFCESIKRMLESEGYTVETATSGLAALELFQRLRFDLVITDYDMPAMSGDKLAKEIHILAPSIPVLMVTGLMESELPSGGSMAGVALLLHKPFKSEELRGAVAKLLTRAARAETQAENVQKCPTG